MLIGRSLGIGRFPGIGMGQLNITNNTFNMDAIILKSNTETFSCDTHIAAQLYKTFNLDTHILTGTYEKAFSMDCNILQGIVFTLDAHLFAILTKTFTCDAVMANENIEQFMFDAQLAAQRTKTFTADALIEKHDIIKTFTTDTHIATREYKTFNILTSIATEEQKTFTCDSHITAVGLTNTFTMDTSIMNWNFKFSNLTMDCTLFKFPKYILNGYDITNHIKTPDISGLIKKTNKYSSPYQILNKIIDMGTENLKYEFELKFTDSHEYDNFLTAVNSDTRDITFYPGRDDIFHKVKSVSVTPVYIFHGSQYRPRVVLELEDPYLYSVRSDHQGYGAVNNGFITIPFKNDGTVITPFEKLELTGVWHGGQHSDNVAVCLMDGSNEISRIPISNRLLHSETATLDINGILKCKYSDDLSTSAKYDVDKDGVNNATWSGGKIRIESGGFVVYKFNGPHPTMYNSKLSATFVVYSGNPVVQVRSATSPWTDAIQIDGQSNWIKKEYYLNGTEKLGDFWVSFYCPPGSVLEIYNMDFETYRDTTYYDLPVINPTETRTAKILVTGSNIAGFDFVFRSRKWP